MASIGTIKDVIREGRVFSERIATATVIATLLMLLLVGRLTYLQIVNHDHYVTLSDGNRINLTPNPPTRGLIYDKNGEILAQNLPSYSLEITPEQISDLDTTIQTLRQLVNISDQNIADFKKQLAQKRAFKSIPLRYFLSDDEVARVASRRHQLKGVDINARLVRDYPYGALAAHTIGYVGRINNKELGQIDATNYRATLKIGKTGIEKTYESYLHGNVGYDQIETNVLGRTLRTINRKLPIPGKNLYLTIDIRLQKVAETALSNQRGAVVAINPKNGHILAMVSLPAFDPNLFVSGISQSRFDQLNQSINKPLFDRSIKGQYPPGSTIKPFIGLAGLEYGKTSISATSYCPGWFSLPGDDHRYRDWKRTGHGLTNLNKAITQSCDVYFYDLAHTLGIDLMHDFLSQFGFGRKTAIDLYGERSGLLPSREWKRKHRSEPWYPGETLIAGIGQGFVLTTPLQLATATAMLANRGAYVQPRIVYAAQDRDGEKLVINEPSKGVSASIASSKNWAHVLSAMQNVVHQVSGTAHGIARNIGYKMSGKTGTAQVFGIKQDEKYKKEDVSDRLRDHALFIGFAPSENPTIAVAVIVENGGSGGQIAAPVARKVVDAYFSLE